MHRTQRSERQKEDDTIIYAEKCFERGFEAQRVIRGENSTGQSNFRINLGPIITISEGFHSFLQLVNALEGSVDVVYSHDKNLEMYYKYDKGEYIDSIKD